MKKKKKTNFVESLSGGILILALIMAFLLGALFTWNYSYGYWQHVHIEEKTRLENEIYTWKGEIEEKYGLREVENLPRIEVFDHISEGE